MMKTLKKINNFIAGIESWLLIVIVLAMVILSFLQVILRNVFAQGIIWGDTFLRHLVLWVGFIGASLATREDKHINIDVLGRLLKGKAQHINQMVINFFSMFIAGYLGWASWRFVMMEKKFGSELLSGLPVWYFQIIIPVGFALMALRFLFSLIENSGKLAGKEAADS